MIRRKIKIVTYDLPKSRDPQMRKANVAGKLSIGVEKLYDDGMAQAVACVYLIYW